MEPGGGVSMAGSAPETGSEGAGEGEGLGAGSGEGDGAGAGAGSREGKAGAGEGMGSIDGPGEGEGEIDGAAGAAEVGGAKELAADAYVFKPGSPLRFQSLDDDLLRAAVMRALSCSRLAARSPALSRLLTAIWVEGEKYDVPPAKPVVDFREAVANAPRLEGEENRLEPPPLTPPPPRDSGPLVPIPPDVFFAPPFIEPDRRLVINALLICAMTVFLAGFVSLLTPGIDVLAYTPRTAG